MDVITLKATARESGKKASKAVRVAKEVPCVLYGHDVESQIFQIPEQELRPLIFTNEFHRVKVKLGRKSFDCILKQVDFHPTTDLPIHVDFQVLVSGEEITLTVPVHYIGESVGLLEGGQAQIFLHEVSIRCLPKDIPDHLEVEISHLAMGDSVLVRDMDFEGITFNVPEDQTLIGIVRPRAIEVEVVEEEELEEGEEGVETEEGATPAEGEADAKKEEYKK